MPSPRQPHPHAPKVETLEPRDQPAASALGNLNTIPVSPFDLFADPGAASAGGSVYFAADDGTHAAAVWKSDGTAAGTSLVAALPARTDGGPVPQPANFTAVNGKVYFTYDDGTHGNELWVTDGTAGGTKQVADLNPGPLGGYPQALTPAGGVLVFLARPANSAAGPGTLFATDGTAAGTVALKELSDYSVGFTASGSKLYFTQGTANPWTPATQAQVWVTDGTKAGTKLFATLPEGVTIPGVYYHDDAWGKAVGSKFYFAGYQSDTGTELWVSDGTAAGTKLVKDINPGGAWTSAPGYAGSSGPAGFAAVGDTLYFSADDGTHGRELWTSDGTAAGTKLVVDLSPDVGSFYPTNPYVYGPGADGTDIGPLTAAAGKLYFSADDRTHGSQLYVSDGTAAATTALTDVHHGGDFTPTTPYGPAGEAPMVAGTTPGHVWFTMGDDTNGRQLWSTDGTKAGTGIVRQIGGPALVPTLSNLTGPVPLGTAGGKFLFHADDGVNGRQLWASDGTKAGTTQVSRINPDDQGSDPGSFLVANGKAYFLAKGGVYVTDGRAAPQLLKAFTPGEPGVETPPAAEAPSRLTASGGKVYFVSETGDGAHRLWTTDGTPAGTVVLHEFTAQDDTNSPWAWNAEGLGNLTDANGTLFFTVDLLGVGQQLWKSNGTVGGTELVKVISGISSNPIGGFPFDPIGGFNPPAPITQFAAVGGKVYFAATSDQGVELWVSNGTLAGTRVVTDISPSADSLPMNLTALNGKLYFTAYDGGLTGRRLWVSDGSSFGTKAVADVGAVPGVDTPYYPYPWSPPAPMAVAGGKLYFVGLDATHQLWTSDGTAAGTKAVTTLAGYVPYPGAAGDPAIGGVTAVGSKVYFTATDAALGKQLYVTDGTAAGTKMVGPVGDGSQAVVYPFSPRPGANPLILTADGTTVYFAADDGVHGRELWKTGGTAATTQLIGDFNPGLGSGVPAGANWYVTPTTSGAVVNGRLVLAVDDGAHGNEPWAVTLAPVVPPTVPPVVPPTTGDVTGPRVLEAAFGGAKAGSFDRVTVRFNEAINPVTLGNATVKVTTPGGPVGVSAVLPVGSDGTKFMLMLAKAQTAGGAYGVTIGPAVADAAGNRMDQNLNGLNGEPADTFAASGLLGAPVVPPAVPPAAGAAVVRTFSPSPTEGSAWTGNLASVTLPAGPDYKVTVLWGDGRSSAGTLTRNTPTGATYTIAGSHLYAEPGARTVQVRVNAGGKVVLAFDLTAAVADARFYVGRTAQRVTAGSPFTGTVATISDTNPGGKASDFEATLAWGDGTTSTGRVVKTAAGKFEVAGDHTFTGAGSGRVTVTVRSLASGKTAAVESIFVIDPSRPAH